MKCAESTGKGGMRAPVTSRLFPCLAASTEACVVRLNARGLLPISRTSAEAALRSEAARRGRKTTNPRLKGRAGEAATNAARASLPGACRRCPAARLAAHLILRLGSRSGTRNGSRHRRGRRSPISPERAMRILRIWRLRRSEVSSRFPLSVYEICAFARRFLSDFGCARTR